MSGARRYQGEIVEWNDEKRFGFVRPRGSGKSDPVVFLTGSSFIVRKRAPRLGDVITYELTRVPPSRNGKRVRTDLKAERAMFLGEEGAVLARSTDYSFLGTFGIIFVLAVLAGIYFVRSAFPIPVIVLSMSLIALVRFGHDKSLAQSGRRRVSENELLWLSLLGGWPGAVMAQSLFRHKTSKASFQESFQLMVALNVVATAALFALFIYDPSVLQKLLGAT